MSLFSRCWHRNVILFAVVCICWEGKVALQPSESEQNEASTELTSTSQNETANATAIIPTTLPEDKSLELEQPKQTSGILNLRCEGIRIRRYMSNGFCTSRRPIREVVCNGKCFAMDELHGFPKFSKIISNHKRAWRCVADNTRTRKITVLCRDGTKRKYHIRLTRSCKCKRYTHKQNQTNP